MTISDIQYETTTPNETDKKHHRKRKEVFGGNVADVKLGCSLDDFNEVYSGWKELVKKPRTLGMETIQNLLEQHPAYQDALFPQEEENEELWDHDEFFRVHSHAVIRGINTMMNNLSGEYEEENEILPTISLTHQKRKITELMMTHLKDSLVETCTSLLNLRKKEREAWNNVFNYIFQNYVLKYYPTEVEEDSQEEK